MLLGPTSGRGSDGRVILAAKQAFCNFTTECQPDETTLATLPQGEGLASRLSQLDQDCLGCTLSAKYAF